MRKPAPKPPKPKTAKSCTTTVAEARREITRAERALTAERTEIETQWKAFTRAIEQDQRKIELAQAKLEIGQQALAQAQVEAMAQAPSDAHRFAGVGERVYLAIDPDAFTFTGGEDGVIEFEFNSSLPPLRIDLERAERFRDDLSRAIDDAKAAQAAKLKTESQIWIAGTLATASLTTCALGGTGTEVKDIEEAAEDAVMDSARMENIDIGDANEAEEDDSEG